VRDARATGPRNAIDQFETGNTVPEPLTCEAALKTTALAAALLFVRGQTTERTVTAAERLGSALGVTVVELVSIGLSAPATLLTTIAANGATAFLIITAMTFGLILPRMLFERVMPSPAR
jgi:hypothetical protein